MLIMKYVVDYYMVFNWEGGIESNYLNVVHCRVFCKKVFINIFINDYVYNDKMQKNHFIIRVQTLKLYIVMASW